MRIPLLLNKMSEKDKTKRGRKRKLTESEKKERKKESNAKLNKNRVYIGDQFDRWDELKEALRLDTHSEVAKILLDRYHSVGATTKKLAYNEEYTSTPRKNANLHITDVSDISASEHEIEDSCKGKKSGVDAINSTINVETDSSFINPFNLTIGKSEGNYEDDEDTSDEDFEPEMDLTFSMLRRDHDIISNIDFDEESEEGGDEDLPEIPLGQAINRVKTDDDIDMLLADIPYLVYLNPLLNLAKTVVSSKCNDCESPITITTETVSSALYLKWSCQNGHLAHTWCSQPILNRRLHSGDVMFSSALLLSGNNFQKISLFSKFMQLPILSSSTFLKIQRTYLVPSIERFWLNQQQTVLDEFKDKDVVLLGDGRMDSPGHSAQYCSYTFLENETKKVLCIVTMDKRFTERKSCNLEKACFIKGLKFLLDKQLRVVEIVTDAHVQIEAVMRKDYPGIKHSFDIWHGAKNLGKKIIKAGQEKQNKSLLEWTRDVVNHFWYCADVTSKSSKTIEEFLGMWFGIIHHVTDEHTWMLSYTDVGINTCRHGPLNMPREKGWLVAGSPAHIALREIVMNKRFIQKVAYYLNCRSTSELENFQNLILKYASKRHAYRPPVYKARNLLAAMDNNANCSRKDLLNKDGSTRYQRYYSKKGGRWSVYPVKEEKGFNYIFELVRSIVKARIEDSEGMNQKMELDAHDPRLISPVLAPVLPPLTSDIVSEKKSRSSFEDHEETINYEWENDENNNMIS